MAFGANTSCRQNHGKLSRDSHFRVFKFRYETDRKQCGAVIAISKPVRSSQPRNPPSVSGIAAPCVERRETIDARKTGLTSCPRRSVLGSRRAYMPSHLISLSELLRLAVCWLTRRFIPLFLSFASRQCIRGRCLANALYANDYNQTVACEKHHHVRRLTSALHKISRQVPTSRSAPTFAVPESHSDVPV